MRAKLGQLLVNAGVLSEKDLDEALQRQIIFGGRLGTNLIEMGLLSEETLLKLLATQLNFPYAEPHLFEDIPKGVIDAVPPELVGKYGVIPLNKDKARIVLAMTDPSRLDILDEIAFHTGLKAKPVLATELRVVQAMERYYGIKRDIRYIAVKAPPKPPPTPAHIPPHQGPGQAQGGRPSSAPVIPSNELIPLELELETLEEGTRGGAEEPLSLESFGRKMVRVTSRDEVADLIVRGAVKVLDDAVLFILKGNEAIGWREEGQVRIPDGVQNWTVKIQPGSLLHLVQESKVLFKGGGAGLYPGNPWLSVCAPKPPEEVLVYPLLLKGRAVTALLGFSRNHALKPEEIEYLERVMKKATLAFEILILQSKLLSF